MKGINKFLATLLVMLAAATPAFASTANLNALSAALLSNGIIPSSKGGAGTISGALKGNGSGTVSQAACADLSNAAASCSTDATNAGNIGSGTLVQARGGTGVSNTATLTLGSSNVNLATLGTGIVKNTTTTGALTDAASADVIGLFTGCSGTQYLGADGACHAAGGSGTVTSIATTAPITGGPITTTGTIACATCATTTNGGALSGSAPIAVSVGGAISIANAAADGSTKGAAAFNSTNFSAASGVVNTIQGISTAATPQFTRMGLGQSADGTASLAFTQAISATSTDGIIVQNATAATVGAQKWSPRIRWTGQGWKTAATAASQEVDAIAEVQPIQGSTNPTFNWVLSGQVNGGGYGALLTVPSGGGLNLNSGTYQINGTQIACSNLSNGATGCSTATGTSGATIGVLNANNTASGNNIQSGTYAITGTSGPTQAAGTLGLAGTATAPTLGANAEGDIFLTTAGGLNYIGQGSTNDQTFLNKSGSSVCTIATGTTTLNCTGLQLGGATPLLPAGGVNLTGGFTATSTSSGTKSSGTFTPSCTTNNLQFITNGGAFTLAPPSGDCTMVIQDTNNGSAGTITTSGFTKVTGDALDTTNAHAFMLYLTVLNSKSVLNVVALQ